MNSQANIAVVAKEQEDFLAFEREFEKNLKELAQAIKESRTAGQNAADISNKGTWKMVWGSISGDNDKELAQMTSKLATSLNVTQTVLQMVMKISHRKNGFLKQFHEVLVNKITLLNKDTRTLDQNQREATVAILEEIKSQVSGQLAQHDKVDEHQLRLESLDRYIEAADLQASTFTQQLALFSSNLGDVRQLGSDLVVRSDAQQARSDAIDAFAHTLHQDLDGTRASVQSVSEALDALRTTASRDQERLTQQEQISRKHGNRISELASLTTRYAQQLEGLEANTTTQRDLIDEQRINIDRQFQRNEALGQTFATMHAQLVSQGERIEHLEGLIKRSSTPSRVLLRYAPALLALALAGVALLRTGSMLVR